MQVLCLQVQPSNMRSFTLLRTLSHGTTLCQWLLRQQSWFVYARYVCKIRLPHNNNTLYLQAAAPTLIEPTEILFTNAESFTFQGNGFDAVNPTCNSIVFASTAGKLTQRLCAIHVCCHGCTWIRCRYSRRQLHDLHTGARVTHVVGVCVHHTCTEKCPIEFVGL